MISFTRKYIIVAVVVFFLVPGCKKSNESVPSSSIVITDGYIIASADSVVGHSVVINFSGSSTAGLTYLWDFGDGTVSTEGGVTHVYMSSQNYLVTLTLNNDVLHKKSKNIFIGPNYEFTETGIPVAADNVTFAVKYSQTGINTYLWNFGDGTLSALSAPVHIYTSPGLYIVSLLVNNDTLRTAKKSVRIIADPLYTSMLQGTKTWHRIETRTNYDAAGPYSLPDTSVAITYIDQITIAVGGTNLIYNPDSSLGAKLFYGSTNLSILYDHITGSTRLHYKWVDYYADYKGPGHHPYTYYDEVWLTP
jgi:PKD repeat protein